VSLNQASGSGDIFLLTQCVPATPFTAYDVGGSFRYASGFGVTPSGGLVAQSRANPDCTGASFGSAGFGLSFSGSPADTWITQTYARGLTTPAGTNSVLIYLRFTTFAAGTAFGWFDDIRFTASDPGCSNPVGVVPDGRLAASTIPAGTTLWFGASLPVGANVGNSYSLEFTNTAGTNVPPGSLTVFSGDDGCTGTSTLTPTDTSTFDPAGPAGIVRVSFTSSGATLPLFRARLVNTSGSPIPFSFSWSDTTMYSPAWSTNGGFDTFYSFQNTTGAALSGTLTLLDTAGVALSSFPLSLPAGQTASANTSGLMVARSKTGTARFTHNGPPGAIVAEAAIANFGINPSYVQPVKFQAVRDAR
jgi:hypothetical protein